MQERRKYKRSELMYYVRIYDRNTGEVIGHLGNITPYGLMIISEEPLQIESKYDLRIELPQELEEKANLEMDAESLWCIPDINPNFYNTGLRLLDLGAEDIRIIEQMVVDYQVHK